MKMKKIAAIAFAVLAVTLVVETGQAFDITGGSAWRRRTGPGLSFGLGLNNCLRDICSDNDYLDTRASIAAMIGFFYRIIPNLVIYVDVQTGHVGVNARGADDDNAFMFHASAGGEFHLPLTGWVAPYTGFGMGFAYLGAWWKIAGDDYHVALLGLNFDLKIGADFFPFSSVPNLSLGPIFRFGFPVWITGCQDEEYWEDKCDDVDDIGYFDDEDDRPHLFFTGVIGRYKF